MRLHKHKPHYTMLITTDAADHHTKQLTLSRGAARFLGVFFFAIVVAVICILLFQSITLKDSQERAINQASEIAELKIANQELESENDSLNSKITVLSETVNQKVKQEEKLEEKSAEESIPNGFPLSSTATMTSSVEEKQKAQEAAAENGEADTETAPEDEEPPYVLFEASEGSTVIATGAGTVTAVDTDPEYGKKIIIDHGNGYQSVYRNHGNALVNVGDQIIRGSLLFIIEDDNKKLRYEIIFEEENINPIDIMEIEG